MIPIWVEFLICASIVVIAGTKLARYGDIIAEKTGLGGAWIGVVLLAVTTSLPELFTGISAVALVGAPDLTIGNLFGANAWNLFNLALLDIASRNVPLLTRVSMGHLLTAALSMVLVSLAAASIFISAAGIELGIGGIGIYTPVILLLYLLMVRMIFKYERRQSAQSSDEAEMTLNYSHLSLARTYIYCAIAAVSVMGAGTWLAFVGDRIADITGLGESFIGSLLIGFTTTLPEFTVSFSALRLGAVDMAVANMFGSNLFNMTIIAMIDPIYIRGPILSYVSQVHILTALVVLLMTGIFIAGLICPPQRKTPLKASWYAIAVMGVFIIGAYLNFIM
ncbi:MAG TPA: cation transporter [Dehalococcoidia bacterium]|nr:cation transporter [Dehalococcoidia bacterium]